MPKKEAVSALGRFISQSLPANSLSLDRKVIHREDPGLLYYAKKYFHGWKAALAAAGVVAKPRRPRRKKPLRTAPHRRKTRVSLPISVRFSFSNDLHPRMMGIDDSGEDAKINRSWYDYVLGFIAVPPSGGRMQQTLQGGSLC
jgi:hypothetical protein